MKMGKDMNFESKKRAKNQMFDKQENGGEGRRKRTLTRR